jgi:uncharacterized integral membrane protein
MGDSVKANLKLTGISVLAIIVLITILQNTEPVVTKILWVEIELPRALLLFITFAVGFGLGYLLFFLRHKKGKNESGPEAPIVIQ